MGIDLPGQLRLHRLHQSGCLRAAEQGCGEGSPRTTRRTARHTGKGLGAAQPQKDRRTPGLACGGEMGHLEPLKVNPMPTDRGSPCGSCQAWRGGRRQEQWQPPCATTRLWEQFPDDLTAPTPHPTHSRHTTHTPHTPRTYSIVQCQHRPGRLFLQGQGWQRSTDVAQGTGVRGHIGLSEYYSRGWGGGSILEKHMGFQAGRLRISPLPPSD